MGGGKAGVSARGEDGANAIPARLELRGIGKSFPGVVANDDISLAVRAGEIHALIGENGAGKSTLVKIIYGVLAADRGDILWEGRPVAIPNPRAARALGIGMVFQHFSLFDALSVLDNIALGLDERLPRAELAARVTAILSSYSLPLDLDRAVGSLSVGERQRIEIVRCLLARPKLLIMDEPTSVLTPQEAERLFALLRQLAAEGCAILYISHKLDEIRALCEAATVLRGGRVVAHCDPRRTGARAMAELMIGAELVRAARRETEERRAQPGAEPAIRLAVDGLSLPRGEGVETPLRDIGFTVGAGEILGIAGVAGNGQAELVLALGGEIRVGPEAIRLDGEPIGALGPGERRSRGLCAVPEERNGHAAVPDLTLAENALLTARQRRGLARSGWLRTGAARDFAAGVIRRFGVRATGPDAAARALSGGNLQKFVVGREIGQDPQVLVVAQPTWGVDAGAAAAIHQALLDLATGGAAIVLVSQDLDELLALSDRLAVLNEGRLSAPMDTRGASLERIGLLMGGVHGETPRPAEAALVA
ncbi:MAG: ABC transporter ATP-binding protein [Methylobacteriaceae bacterium]|nr:ABC transporter ATP-binding protein [Methylobacteriaceae bacterium]